MAAMEQQAAQEQMAEGAGTSPEEAEAM